MVRKQYERGQGKWICKCKLKNEKNKAGYVGVGMYDISISDGGSCKCRK